METTIWQQPIKTPWLLWNMLWRGGVIGTGGGSVLGAGYGALFTGIVFLGDLAHEIAQEGVGALAGLSALIPFAMLVGAVSGALAGLLVGLMLGLVIGLVTRIFFFPLSDVGQYRLSVRLSSVAVIAIGASIGLITIGDTPPADFWLAFLAVPAIIAGFAAWWASMLIAEWYETEAGGAV